jgi:ribosomal protein S27E
MSEYGSVEVIRRKIREGVYSTFVKDTSTNELWKYFLGITSVENGEVVKLPYVSCVKCGSVLTYNSKTGGTSHLRRHADVCQAKSSSSSSCPGIGSFFKPTGVSAAVKSHITEK